VGDATTGDATTKLIRVRPPGSNQSLISCSLLAQSRRVGKGTRPDMGSWITQAASRRITRTDARVIT